MFLLPYGNTTSLMWHNHEGETGKLGWQWNGNPDEEDPEKKYARKKDF